MTLPAWFLARTKPGPNDCIEWAQGKIDGYGIIRFEGQVVRAHRLAWFLEHGPFTKVKSYVLHRCDNPPCVNPEHLWLGTHADNMADMVRKGRGRALAGNEHWNARLDWPQVEEIRRCAELGIPQIRLAERFMVTPSTIHQIVHHKIWRVA